MPRIPATLPRRETIFSAVLYLMTKHAQAPCPILGRAVADHLDLLARYPADEGSPESRELLQRLATTWNLLANGGVSRLAHTAHTGTAAPSLQ